MNRLLRASFPIVLSLVLFRPVLGAQGGRPAQSPFRFERQVAAPPATAVRLPVDVDLLAGGLPFAVSDDRAEMGLAPAPIGRGGLADLRFFDAAGHEVPYLLVEPVWPRPTWRPSAPMEVAATKTSSGFELDLGEPVAIDRLRLDGVAAPFLKRVSLEGSGDRSRWTILVADGTVFDLPDQQMAERSLAFAAGEFRYLRLTWDDRSSARVNIPPNVAVRLAAPTPPPATGEASVFFSRRPSEPRTSRFRITLPASHLPVVGLRVEIGESRLLRDARVTECRLAGSGAEPVLLGRGLLARADAGGLTAATLRIPLSQPSQPSLDLVVDDGDNPPIDLRRVIVEFAALPWIYLETPASGTVVARYGAPRATAPRYDLEAAREKATAGQVAAAAWGPVTPLSAALSAPAPLALAATGASADPAAFRFSRPVPAGPSGLVSLDIDAAVMAHSAGPGSRFRDVRIVDAQNRQVPYLVERRGEPTIVPLQVERLGADPAGARADRGTTSRYRVRLPYGSLPPAMLVLRTRAAVFERQVAVSAEFPAADRRSGPRRVILSSATWRHASETDEAPALALSIPSIATTDVRLEVDEGDNEPLPIEGVELLLPGARLRFFRPDAGQLRMLYGAPELAPPQYHLQLLATTVLEGVAQEIAPGPEEERSAPGTAQWSIPPALFYLMLAAVSVVLLAMIGRALRARPTPPVD